MKAEHLFRKGAVMMMKVGGEPFYMCDVNKKAGISLARLEGIRDMLLEANLIKAVKSDSHREHHFRLTEKGEKVQENLIAIGELIR